MRFAIEDSRTNRMLSRCYAGVSSVRNRLYDAGVLSSYATSIPVISVGNATVGGSGKSPFAQYLADELRRRGFRPVILLRGYGAQSRGPHLVNPFRDSAELVGDEALMHAKRGAQRVPVVIARRRVAGALFIEQHGVGDVIILDDGLQHRRLARSFDCLLVDVSSVESRGEWFSGGSLPAGRFREAKRDAVRRADAIVFVNRGPASISRAEMQQLHADCRGAGFTGVFSSYRLAPTILRDMVSGESKSVELCRGRRVASLSAIARPEGLIEMITGFGADEVLPFSFPDHYFFTSKDLHCVSKSAAEIVVMTEKDAVKIKNIRELGKPTYILCIDCLADGERENQSFWENVLPALQPRAEKRASAAAL